MTERLTKENEKEIRDYYTRNPDAYSNGDFMRQLLAELDAVRKERDALFHLVESLSVQLEKAKDVLPRSVPL